MARLLEGDERWFVYGIIKQFYKNCKKKIIQQCGLLFLRENTSLLNINWYKKCIVIMVGRIDFVHTFNSFTWHIIENMVLCRLHWNKTNIFLLLKRIRWLIIQHVCTCSGANSLSSSLSLRDSFLEGKLLRFIGDHSPQSNTEVNNKCSCNPHFSTCHHCMVHN